MKKIITVLLLFLLIPVVSAQNAEEVAGTTPDSIFYGLDVFFDEAAVFLTPNALDKAELRLKIMQERMAEMEVMASRNKMAEMKKAESEGQTQMQLVGNLVKHVRPEDAPRLNESLQRHALQIEECRQRLMVIRERIRADESLDVDIEELDESIANAMEMIETSEKSIDHVGEAITDTFNMFMNASVGPVGHPLPDVRNMTAEEREAWEQEREEEARIREEEQKEKFGFTCNEGGGVSTGRNLITGETRETEWCCDDSDRDFVYTAYDDSRYYGKGTVQYKVINIKEGPEEGAVLEYETHTDSCDGDTLTEWGCGGSEHIYSETYDCPDGCSDGACIDKEGRFGGLKEFSEGGQGYLDNCIDSDGGADFYVKGTLSTPEYNATDFCKDDSTLAEFSCGFTTVSAGKLSPVGVYSHCPNGCRDGACIREE